LTAIIAHAGCKNESMLRPPKNPEEYKIPPGDARYTQPPEPPKEYLNQDWMAKNRADPNNPSTPGTMGRGSGAGGIH
jgi:hypothetical protein